MNREAMFKSSTDNVATPQWLFDELDSVFHFDLDACATAENAKCERFYTKQDDALKKTWGGRYFVTHRMESRLSYLSRKQRMRSNIMRA